MELVLIRHAQSANNLLWERTGASDGRHPDPTLTDLGEQQVAQLGEWLTSDPEAPRPTALHTSYMWRAVQTGAVLADALDLTLHGHPDIFEVGGPYELDADGTTPVALPGATPRELASLSGRLHAGGLDPEVGWWGGPYEARERVAARAESVLAWLRSTYETDDVVALVTHGFFTQFLIGALLGAGEMTGWIQIDNTGVSRFLLEEEQAVATLINGVAHLAPDQRSL